MNYSHKLSVLWLSIISLYVMGLLFIQLIMIPTWNDMDPEQFLKWSTSFGSKVGLLMAPLLALSLITGIVLLLKQRKEGKNQRFYLVIFSVSILIVQFILLFTYFLPVDLEFANQTIPIHSVKERLVEWKNWHTLRTVIAFLAWISTIRYATILT